MQDRGHKISSKPLLRVLDGEALHPPPVWLMRQAGRYLPEYRKLRSQARDFLSLCYNPDLASEITLQPIARFNFDAAIIFSDILVVPDALGLKVNFVESQGPILTPVRNCRDISRLGPAESVRTKLAPICETIVKTRKRLPENVSLIGFAGAPWTVATYMIAGRSEAGHKTSIQFLNSQPGDFAALIQKITSATIEYLSMQIDSGVDVVKIFDSWAGSLEGLGYEHFVTQPNRQIVSALKKLYPEVPIITFPRLSGSQYADFAKTVKPDCLAIDDSEDLRAFADQLGGTCCLQGNLSPRTLLVGGANLQEKVRSILAGMIDHPHIFNLGHGILPQTPVQNVDEMLRIIRGE